MTDGSCRSESPMPRRRSSIYVTRPSKESLGFPSEASDLSGLDGIYSFSELQRRPSKESYEAGLKRIVQRPFTSAEPGASFRRFASASAVGMPRSRSKPGVSRSRSKEGLAPTLLESRWPVPAQNSEDFPAVLAMQKSQSFYGQNPRSAKAQKPLTPPEDASLAATEVWDPAEAPGSPLESLAQSEIWDPNNE